MGVANNANWSVFFLLLRLFIYAGIYSIFSALIDKPAFPSVIEIYEKLGSEFWVSIFSNFPATMWRWFVVFSVGTILGVFLGAIIGYFKPIYKVLSFEIDVLRSLPATALITFIIAAFGDNEFTRSFPALYVCFFTVVFYIAKHSSEMNRCRINHLTDLGATKVFILKNCVFYELLPTILIAARQAVSLSFLILISVEIMVGSSENNGIGDILYDASYYADYGKIITILVFIGAIGYFLNAISAYISSKMLPWIKE